MRNACPARFLVLRVRLLNTLPPEISCLGANPSQAQKCFSLGNFSCKDTLLKQIHLIAPVPLRPRIYPTTEPDRCDGNQDRS